VRIVLPLLSLCAIGAVACTTSAIPDPKDAVKAYAEAAAKGDATAIYAMMSEKSRVALTQKQVGAMVADERGELADQAKALGAAGVVIKARARVRYADGEDAALDLEEGVFHITAADALPAGARTPAQALEQLRRVLARRSYAGMMRVLSPSTRSAIEADLRSLVLGLEKPEGLEVRVTGDTATVQVPGGHEVKLRREAGVWHIDTFD
jgi:hypothetical protein